MIDEAIVTNRNTQNTFTPNLPFAQTWPIHSEQPTIPINFGQSTSRREDKFLFTIVGSTFLYGTKNTTVFLTESIAQLWRNRGYTVTRTSDTPMETKEDKPKTPRPNGNGTTGLTRNQVKDIIESEHGDDVKGLWDSVQVLHDKHVEQQTYFDKKLESQITDHATFHSKFENLGTSVSDVSSALTTHEVVGHWGGGGGNGNGNGCGTFDILCHFEKFKAQIGGVALIGGAVLVGYFLLKRRVKR